MPQGNPRFAVLRLLAVIACTAVFLGLEAAPALARPGPRVALLPTTTVLDAASRATAARTRCLARAPAHSTAAVVRAFLSNGCVRFEILFASTTSQLRSLRTGDVVASVPAPGLPAGAFGRVLRLARAPGGGLRLTGGPARLEDAMRVRGAVHVRAPIEQRNSAARSPRAKLAIFDDPFHWRGTLGGDGRPFELYAGIPDVTIGSWGPTALTASGYARASGLYAFLDYDPHGTRTRFALGYGVERWKLSLSLLWQGGWSPQRSAPGFVREWTIAKAGSLMPIVLWIGPLPVPFYPELRFFAGVEGKVNLGLRPTITLAGGYRAAFEIDAAGAPRLAFDAKPPKVDLSGLDTADADPQGAAPLGGLMLRPMFGVKFVAMPGVKTPFGPELLVAGPYIGLRAYADLTLSPHLPPGTADPRRVDGLHAQLWAGSDVELGIENDWIKALRDHGLPVPDALNRLDRWISAHGKVRIRPVGARALLFDAATGEDPRCPDLGGGLRAQGLCDWWRRRFPVTQPAGARRGEAGPPTASGPAGSTPDRIVIQPAGRHRPASALSDYERLNTGVQASSGWTYEGFCDLPRPGHPADATWSGDEWWTAAEIRPSRSFVWRARSLRPGTRYRIDIDVPACNASSSAAAYAIDGTPLSIDQREVDGLQPGPVVTVGASGAITVTLLNSGHPGERVGAAAVRMVRLPPARAPLPTPQ